jgi:hypothetical protein
LDRLVSTREALIHSIPINEVKDMKSDVLRAFEAFLSKILTLDCVFEIYFNNFQGRKIT